MKTLVIHPQDKSTDFLRPIYAGLDDVTLVTRGWTVNQVREAIQTHDQVMMMGHGSPNGLFAVGQFPIDYPHSSHIIGASMVEALAMFVSEVGEAFYCGVKTFDQASVDESNDAFARQLGECLGATRAPDQIFDQIRDQYGLLAETNAIAEYNHQRLYLN